VDTLTWNYIKELIQWYTIKRYAIELIRLWQRRASLGNLYLSEGGEWHVVRNAQITRLPWYRLPKISNFNVTLPAPRISRSAALQAAIFVPSTLFLLDSSGNCRSLPLVHALRGSYVLSHNIPWLGHSTSVGRNFSYASHSISLPLFSLGTRRLIFIRIKTTTRCCESYCFSRAMNPRASGSKIHEI